MKYKYKFECDECDHVVIIEGTDEQWASYARKTRNIQDIFPELSAADRELMLSGICGDCFDKLFS